MKTPEQKTAVTEAIKTIEAEKISKDSSDAFVKATHSPAELREYCSALVTSLELSPAQALVFKKDMDKALVAMEKSEAKAAAAAAKAAAKAAADEKKAAAGTKAKSGCFGKNTGAAEDDTKTEARTPEETAPASPAPEAAVAVVAPVASEEVAAVEASPEAAAVKASPEAEATPTVQVTPAPEETATATAAPAPAAAPVQDEIVAEKVTKTSAPAATVATTEAAKEECKGEASTPVCNHTEMETSDLDPKMPETSAAAKVDEEVEQFVAPKKMLSEPVIDDEKSHRSCMC